MSPKPLRRKLPTGHIALGRVLAPHRLQGDVQIAPLTDVAAHFDEGRQLWLKGGTRTIERSHWRRGHVFVKLSGVDSVESAEELRGADVSVPQDLLEPLPEGQFYRFEIVGLTVFDVEGRDLGKIVDVLSTGGNDVYVVRGERGEVLVPAIEDVVREVDVSSGRMVVELMEGMLPSG